VVLQDVVAHCSLDAGQRRIAIEQQGGPRIDRLRAASELAEATRAHGASAMRDGASQTATAVPRGGKPPLCGAQIVMIALIDRNDDIFDGNY
jgi:hypothetical protein